MGVFRPALVCACICVCVYVCMYVYIYIIWEGGVAVEEHHPSTRS